MSCIVMARPIEFLDLKQTSVTVERSLLERAKADGVNVSEVLRKALANELGEAPKKLKTKIGKFKGLPRHVVTKAKNNIIASTKNVPLTIEWLNRDFGINCNAADLDALVPRF